MLLAFTTIAPVSIRSLFVAQPAIESKSPRPIRTHSQKVTLVAVTSPPTPVFDSLDPSQIDQTTFDNVVMSTYARYPITMSHGNGATLTSTDGHQFIDCAAGIATCTLGHAHPAIIKAISEQVKRITHVSNLYYIAEQGALANWLVNNSPADRVFFCNSGGEANEAAIKLARKNWRLANPNAPSNSVPIIITAKQSFHGRTMATLTATGQPKYHKHWGPLLAGFDYATYNDIEDLRAAVTRAGPQLAAILLEAVQGEGGIRPATKEFFKEARELCDKNGALLMCDEVQCGVGRTGKLWGFEHTGVDPDVITTAKGLGGGVPIGAMLCKKWCDKFEPGDHASTFGGNPLASAAGIAIGKELTQGGVLNNAKERGEQLQSGLSKIASNLGSVVKEIRGHGLMIGVEFNELIASQVVNKAMENGVLLVPAGKHVVRFVPPLVITEEQINQVLQIFESVLKQE